MHLFFYLNLEVNSLPGEPLKDYLTDTLNPKSIEGK